MVHSVHTALSVLDAAPIHRCRYADEMIICCWSMPELVPSSWRSQKAPLIMITSGSTLSPTVSRRYAAALAIDAAPTLSSSWASWVSKDEDSERLRARARRQHGTFSRSD